MIRGCQLFVGSVIVIHLASNNRTHGWNTGPAVRKHHRARAKSILNKKNEPRVLLNKSRAMAASFLAFRIPFHQATILALSFSTRTMSDDNKNHDTDGEEEYTSADERRDHGDDDDDDEQEDNEEDTMQSDESDDDTPPERPATGGSSADSTTIKLSAAPSATTKRRPPVRKPGTKVQRQETSLGLHFPFKKTRDAIRARLPRTVRSISRCAVAGHAAVMQYIIQEMLSAGMNELRHTSKKGHRLQIQHVLNALDEDVAEVCGYDGSTIVMECPRIKNIHQPSLIDHRLKLVPKRQKKGGAGDREAEEQQAD